METLDEATVSLLQAGHAIALFKALPSMFPSPMPPPKKLGPACEALFHVLEPSEDPNMFLQRRPITSPVFLVGSTNLLLTTLPKEMIHEAPLILMGCCYIFHLTYPKCGALCCSQPSEDPNMFLQRRPITSPVFLVGSTNLLLTTLPKEMIHEAPLILMGCYIFHLTYPKCGATLLAVIQNEVLKDSIHERDPSEDNLYLGPCQ
uniref:uncharacterized protein LOC131129804 isoform X2 n=1 Tax=Doryrhamphus excisus TaxID=161450 RepID=UPI0025ADB325|nr:uncharacterized protein LOC131129804 isoform X2 [Doryrhamphus excisus]XP_057929666.1 uncharacterized protein LOC131129804 isoform X2 [Doryrhamphus excisus]